MPAPRLIAWMVGLSLFTTIALEKFRSKGAPALHSVRKTA